MKSPKYKKDRPNIPVLNQEFNRVFAAFNVHDCMFVRKCCIPACTPIGIMQERMLTRNK